MKQLLRCAVAAGWAALLLAAGPAPAQAPQAAPVGPAARAAAVPVEFKLVNGMTLIVKPDHRAPTAVHMVWLRVGAMDETDGTSGVAHVLEHMLFKGTDKLAAGEFSRRIAAMGGRENAFTGRDYTGYHQQIPADRLEEVMRLEADRFAHNRWPDDEFRRELEVVKEERRLRILDSPRAMLHEVLDAVTFTVSPYRRPVSGWASDLEAMTPQDAREFYRRWYVPANAVVVVAGDVDPQQVLRLAQKHYGSIPARAVPPRKPREEPVQAGIRRVEHKAPAEQSYVALSFKVPQLRSFEASAAADDAVALTVLAAVLDGYRGARLDRALTQGPDRVADSVGADNGLWGRGPQTFTLDGVPAAGKTPEQVEAALRAEVARVAREGVTEDELQRVKTRWVAAEVYKRDSVFAQARELGSFWALGLPLDASERLMARLKAVTAAQVQSVAQRFFGDDQLTVGILRPLPRDPAEPKRAPPTGSRHGGDVQ
ncbi:pitrilysin family protein [Ramlibacter tataouinensis]|uniref:M16 family metallopeptidase n=1 Tax=Ramlibacter tataouinensis TaxID=94132 RepID=UPI0022F3F7FE|nr:pitrilysin family protein [Ramlibacter tataouinensis]WBY00488.1 pitrilysin family protein [Ramlibacter tataouinensis]